MIQQSVFSGLHHTFSIGMVGGTVGGKTVQKMQLPPNMPPTIEHALTKFV
jgi:hypothetical protein